VPVDLDRLAEYAAGLLAPDAASEVEALLDDEPEWADALTALTAAEPAVRSALAELGAPAVPDDVLARLDAAFAAEWSAGTAPGQVVELAARRAKRPARRWRPSHLAAGLTAAAAVIGIALGGVALVGNVNGGAEKSSNGMAAQGPAPAAPQSLPTVSSGRDYTAATIASAAGGDAAGGRNPNLAESAGPPSETDSDATDPLARLRDPVARATCLNLVLAVHAGTPTLVDYARFDGQPALVVVLSGGSGPIEVVVVGADCGVAGTDQLYATAVG
jgi:hypothetical protein